MRTSRSVILPALLTILPLGIVLAVIWQVLVTPGDRYAVEVFFSAYRAQHPMITQIFKVITDWGNAGFYVVYAVLLWRAWRAGDRAQMRFVFAYVAVQVLVSFLLVRALKISIGAPRPDASGFNQPGSLSSSYNSMPSGHTTEIVGAALPLALRARCIAVSALLGLVVLAVGFSRIYLGKHHPADVLCGMLLGSWAGLVITAVAGRAGAKRTKEISQTADNA